MKVKKKIKLTKLNQQALISFWIDFWPWKGPFVDAADSIWVGVQSDRHLLECTPVASSGMLAQPGR